MVISIFLLSHLSVCSPSLPSSASYQLLLPSAFSWLSCSINYTSLLHSSALFLHSPHLNSPSPLPFLTASTFIFHSTSLNFTSFCHSPMLQHFFPSLSLESSFLLFYIASVLFSLSVAFLVSSSLFHNFSKWSLSFTSSSFFFFVHFPSLVIFSSLPIKGYTSEKNIQTSFDLQTVLYNFTVEACNISIHNHSLHWNL